MISQEATRLRVKNWEKFQHYHNRDPKWIKLYSDTLSDYKFNKLPDESKAHLVLIWLLAARIGGYVPLDAEWISRKISATTDVNLTLLVDSGFLIPCNDDGDILFASKLLAGFANRASLEREGEKEKENTGAASNLPVDSPSPTIESHSGLPFVTSHGNTWRLSAELYAKYLTAYPNLDIDAELAKAQAWCESNPRKRKTARGMPSFLTRWLNRAADSSNNRGGGGCDYAEGPKTGAQILAMLAPDDGGDE